MKMLPTFPGACLSYQQKPEHTPCTDLRVQSENGETSQVAVNRTVPIGLPLLGQAGQQGKGWVKRMLAHGTQIQAPLQSILPTTELHPKPLQPSVQQNDRAALY